MISTCTRLMADAQLVVPKSIPMDFGIILSLILNLKNPDQYQNYIKITIFLTDIFEF